MANTKVKMSTSYMLVFILSIVMVFVVLALSGATKSKGGGVGVFIWGYTAWLMYKQRTEVLISLYKSLLWMYTILFTIGFIFLAIDSGGERVGFSLIYLLVLAVFQFTLTYALFLFFKNNISNTTIETNSSFSEEHFWQIVSDEMSEGKRIDSLWARAFSESEGDKDKTNARYLKLRFEQVKREFINTRNTSNKVKIDSPIQTKLGNPIKVFWDGLNGIGKFCLVAIIVAISISLGFDFFDPFDENNPTGWTQENTKIKIYGSYLTDNAPFGTRLCRDGEGNIQRLFPPGASTSTNLVDPICFKNSKKKLY